MRSWRFLKTPEWVITLGVQAWLLPALSGPQGEAYEKATTEQHPEIGLTQIYTAISLLSLALDIREAITWLGSTNLQMAS
jgi:hypothetical protein